MKNLFFNKYVMYIFSICGLVSFAINFLDGFEQITIYRVISLISLMYVIIYQFFLQEKFK